MDSFALAALYARQLIDNLPNVANMRDPQPDGKQSARQVIAIRKLFFDILDRWGAKQFLEIGCHDAEASVEFVGRRGDRRAHAIEAIPLVCERARKACASDAVEFHNIALGSHNGEATFHVPVDERFKIWGSLRKRFDSPVETEEIVVPLATLQTAVEKFGLRGENRDIGIWMDVEGAALEILEGGIRFLSEEVAAIYVEIEDDRIFEGNPASLRLLSLLLETGFIPVARDNQFPGAYNLLAVHRQVYENCYDRLSRFFIEQRRHSLAAAP